MLFEHIYTRRGWLASLPSLLVIALAALWAKQALPVKPAAQAEPAITLRMVELPPPPRPAQVVPPPLPQPPEPTKAAPTPPKPEPVVRERSAPVITPPAPPPTPSTPTALPAASPASVVKAEPRPAPAPTPMAAPASVAPAPTVPASATVEANYIAQLRAQLERSKRYPTGREASLMRPSGMVRVWLVLDRSGRLLDSGVDKSSESMLLDHAALSSVRRGEYPAFPAETWANDSSHRFTVDMNYTPAN